MNSNSNYVHKSTVLHIYRTEGISIFFVLRNIVLHTMAITLIIKYYSTCNIAVVIIDAEIIVGYHRVSLKFSIQLNHCSRSAQGTYHTIVELERIYGHNPPTDNFLSPLVQDIIGSPSADDILNTMKNKLL